MPVVDRGHSIQIPHGTTRAQLGLVDTKNIATVNVKDHAGTTITTFKLDSFHQRETATIPAPPAGQAYDLYNVGPSGLNVTWL